MIAIDARVIIKSNVIKKNIEVDVAKLIKGKMLILIFSKLSKGFAYYFIDTFCFSTEKKEIYNERKQSNVTNVIFI